MKHSESSVQSLLEAWENTYKKGQLTLWIFIALREGPKYVDEIRTFVEEKSKGTITCEEQSLYRALRKYEYIDVLSHELRRGNKGPDRKYYKLTDVGNTLFDRFVRRNIHLFYAAELKTLLNFKSHETH